MTDTFTQQRLTHLESLAAELPDRGMVSRMLGGDDPVLWVWHPSSGKQTIVFATPAKEGWLYLWSPDGQEGTAHPAQVAESVKQLLAGAPVP
ncbi:hypothetical protein HS041_13855 [Planomonospora sp. ID67723]|uniref:hypothetical protein n=1 Tax=Planomonospora sp. ID67723 TaxID=2738134 RepID=UPI0018C42332|nr:hypothetical protein [Planomonospora sp. ID67723]MBG0828854.1 hypothetical protein [Planomonospora sp. ID67723]